METKLNIISSKKYAFFSLKKLFVIIYLELKASMVGSTLAKFINPTMYLLFFSVGIKGMIGQNILYEGREISYFTYIIPGILSMFANNYLINGLSRSLIDKKWGLTGLKMMNGVSPFTYIIGMSICNYFFSVMQTSLIIFLSSIILSSKFNIKNILLTYLLQYLSVLFWTSLGILLGMIVKNYQQRDFIINIITIPIMFTAPIFYSISGVPIYFKFLSYINPLTYFVQLIRKSLISNIDIRIACLSIGMTSVCLIITCFAIKNAEMKSGVA